MMRLMIGLCALVLLFFVLSLSTGYADIKAIDSLAALFDDDYGALTLVMREIRLPRSLLAIIIGAGMGVAGAAMQGYLRNPLAEPGLLGVSASAALGAVVAMSVGVTDMGGIFLPLAALAGAFGCALLMIALAGSNGASLPLILAGIAISALATALTALMLNLSSNPFAANEIVFWMMGSLADRSMLHVWLALPLVALGIVLLLTLGRALDALTLGEDTAQSMGIHLVRMRLVLVCGTACIAGASTAVAGVIGFIGLVVPHILRPWVGGQPSRLLWASALGGAAMLQMADIAVRVILPARDLKLGVVTALIGAPLFLHLIYKIRQEQ